MESVLASALLGDLATPPPSPHHQPYLGEAIAGEALSELMDMPSLFQMDFDDAHTQGIGGFDVQPRDGDEDSFDAECLRVEIFHRPRRTVEAGRWRKIKKGECVRFDKSKGKLILVRIHAMQLPPYYLAMHKISLCLVDARNDALKGSSTDIVSVTNETDSTVSLMCRVYCALGQVKMQVRVGKRVALSYNWYCHDNGKLKSMGPSSGLSVAVEDDHLGYGLRMRRTPQKLNL